MAAMILDKITWVLIFQVFVQKYLNGGIGFWLMSMSIHFVRNKVYDCSSYPYTWRMGRFSMVGGIHTHLDDMLVSQIPVNRLDPTYYLQATSRFQLGEASMSSKWVWIPNTLENLPIVHDRPMVHSPDRESKWLRYWVQTPLVFIRWWGCLKPADGT